MKSLNNIQDQLHFQDNMWGLMMKAVPKLDESESGQMVLKQVKWALSNVYHKQCGILQKIQWKGSNG